LMWYLSMNKGKTSSKAEKQFFPWGIGDRR